MKKQDQKKSTTESIFPFPMVHLSMDVCPHKHRASIWLLAINGPVSDTQAHTNNHPSIIPSKTTCPYPVLPLAGFHPTHSHPPLCLHTTMNRRGEKIDDQRAIGNVGQRKGSTTIRRNTHKQTVYKHMYADTQSCPQPPVVFFHCVWSECRSAQRSQGSNR